MALEEEVLVGGNFPDKEAERSFPKPEGANSKLTEKKNETNKQNQNHHTSFSNCLLILCSEHILFQEQIMNITNCLVYSETH